LTGPITWEAIGFLCVLAVPVCGAWWFLYSDILAVRRELQDYKLEVAQRYASVEHLKEVENRLVTAIDKLAAQLDTMPDRLSRIIQQAIRDTG
jgi:hypothetical protein